MASDDEMLVVDAGEELIGEHLDPEPVPFSHLEAKRTFPLDAGQMAGG